MLVLAHCCAFVMVDSWLQKCSFRFWSWGSLPYNYNHIYRQGACVVNYSRFCKKKSKKKWCRPTSIRGNYLFLTIILGPTHIIWHVMVVDPWLYHCSSSDKRCYCNCTYMDIVVLSCTHTHTWLLHHHVKICYMMYHNNIFTTVAILLMRIIVFPKLSSYSSNNL
jgi:hypothetical protein